jgi:hypothetical protein
MIDYKITWNADHTEQTEEEYAHSEGRLVMRITRKFDQSGRLLSVVEEDVSVAGQPPIVTKRSLTYDARGRIQAENEESDGKVIPGAKYQYDGPGNLVRIERFDNTGRLSQTEYIKYNDNLLKQSVELQDHSGAIDRPQLQVKYGYDSENRLASEKRFTGQCDSAGRSAGKCFVEEVVDYKYDSAGRVVATETFKKGGNSPAMRLRIEYSSNR